MAKSTSHSIACVNAHHLHISIHPFLTRAGSLAHCLSLFQLVSLALLLSKLSSLGCPHHSFTIHHSPFVFCLCWRHCLFGSGCFSHCHGKMQLSVTRCTVFCMPEHQSVERMPACALFSKRQRESRPIAGWPLQWLVEQRVATTTGALWHRSKCATTRRHKLASQQSKASHEQRVRSIHQYLLRTQLRRQRDIQGSMSSGQLGIAQSQPQKFDFTSSGRSEQH